MYIYTQILCSKECLCKLLECWREDEPLWFLFQSSGGSFSCAAVKAWVPAYVLQVLSALYDHFISYLTKSALALYRLLDPNISQADSRACIDDFVRLPSACLAPGFRCLRQRYTTASAFAAVAPHILRALSRGTPLSVDPCERMHAQVRTDMHSSGTSKSATASANRTLCRLVRSAHLEKSGLDCSGLARVWLPISDSASEGALVASQGLPRTSCRGGNAFFCWRNNRLSTYKKTRMPDRPMSAKDSHRLTRVYTNGWGPKVFIRTFLPRPFPPTCT